MIRLLPQALPAARAGLTVYLAAAPRGDVLSSGMWRAVAPCFE
jgi:hypothetical protein